ncbi:MAG: helix-turn-helix domain-containing protein [Syntrophomonadaceae bacterium]|nr:helix-turn-helix domain-containing protein [Syntrophomonadaceae bacterium]
MNTLGEFIGSVRRRKGLSLRDLATRCGLSHSYIDSLEKGLDPRTGKPVSPTLETIQKLADGLDMTFSEFLYMSGIVSVKDGESRVHLSDPSLPYAAEHKVPLLGAVRTGTPLLAPENHAGDLKIPADVKADFALRVKDYSLMGVGICQGDYAICRTAVQANPGDIVVVLQDVPGGFSEIALKYFSREGEKLVLRAAHPDVMDIPLGAEPGICGIMVALLKKQPPPYLLYRQYISTWCCAATEWSEVVEKALQCGMEPETVKMVLENYWEVARRIWEKENK